MTLTDPTSPFSEYMMCAGHWNLGDLPAVSRLWNSQAGNISSFPRGSHRNEYHTIKERTPRNQVGRSWFQSKGQSWASWSVRFTKEKPHNPAPGHLCASSVCVSLTWPSCAFTHFTDEKAQRPSSGSEHSTGCFYDLLAHDIWKGTWNLHFNMGGF